MTAPIAHKLPKQRLVHGDLFIDDYDWLKDRTNPEVMAYIEAENAYTEEIMASSADLQTEIYGDLRGYLKEDDTSAPVQRGDYFYYTRTEVGKEYAVYCRKYKSLDHPEEILLDANREAEKHAFYTISAFKVSPDHERVAFVVDVDGSESYQLLIKDLSSGEILACLTQQACTFLEWANDSQHLFYTVVDRSLRSYQLYRHTLGESESDVLIYTETDGGFFLQLEKSKDQQYILMNLVNFTTTEVRYVNAHKPLDPWQVFQPRVPELIYKVASHGNQFFVLSNHEAANFCLLRTPSDRTEMSYWQPVLAEDADIKRDAFEVFETHIALYEREAGVIYLRILALDTLDAHRIALPESAYLVSPAANPDFTSHEFNFQYSSLVQPLSLYRYDMQTRQLTLIHQKEVPGYNPADYHSERLWVEVKGVQVPLSIVYKKSLRQNGPQPTHLYGYGAYGTNVDPYFSTAIVGLLDRGFVYAIAHVRGGGMLGPRWYADGKLQKKQNSFQDFIACAEHLMEQGYTSPEHLSIEGRSAGGLLVGAVVNMRPDLFRAVVAEVPFVDVTNTMLDDSLALTVTAYEEWGNPNVPTDYAYMRAYSPYDNVSAQDYPHMLVISGMNDPRVTYWEPTKWVARLRAHKTDHHTLLLNTQMNAGHMGASGRFEYLKQTAFKYAFLVQAHHNALTK